MDLLADKLTRNVCLGLIALFVLTLPFLLGTYLVFVFTVICVYAIVAMGMNILSGYTGMLSLGHQAFFGIGAYAAAILSTRYPGFPFPVALLVGGFLSAVIGYLLGFSALRTSGVYLAIATIAFGMIMAEVFGEWASLTGGQVGLVVPSPAIGPLRFESATAIYYLTLAVAAVMFFLGMNLISSNTGRAFIAIRENEISAQSYGISLVKYKTLSFAISAFYVGVAGGIYAYLLKYVVLVDEDIDPSNTADVLWAIASRTDPERSIDFVRDLWGSQTDPVQADAFEVDLFQVEVLVGTGIDLAQA